MWKWTDGDSLDFPAICQDSHGSRFTTRGNEQTRSCQEKKWTPGQGMWEMNSKLWALLYELSHLCEPWSLALSSAGATGWWHHTVCVLVTQACQTLCDPMDCTQPGSSVHGLLQARILEWVAISFSRGSSQPRDGTGVSCIAGRSFYVFVTLGVEWYPSPLTWLQILRRIIGITFSLLLFIWIITAFAEFSECESVRYLVVSDSLRPLEL